MTGPFAQNLGKKDETIKTAVIFDRCEANIEFYVLNGDYRHLDNIYINDFDNEEELNNELDSLFYEDNGKNRQEEVSKTEFEQAIREGATMIVVGLLP